MSLAIITADYPPKLGGIARYMGDIALFLSRHWNVRVYQWTNDTPAQWMTHPWAGCIDPEELANKPQATASRLRQEGVQHVFFSHIDIASPRAVLAFRRAGLPCSVFIYGADINIRRPARIHARMYATAALMTHRIVISNGTRAIFRRRLPGLSTHMITPGIELPERPSTRRGPGEGIVSVGRLVRRKGFDTLLDAVAILKREGIMPPLTIIGDGPDRAWLMERAATLGLDTTTRVVSGLSDEEVRQQLATHRAFCLLPRSLGNGDVEGFGIVFLEAAREGLPVVAGRSGGVPDAVNDGGNGWLVDPVNASDAARRLKAILTDDDLWRRQSEAGIAWYRSFSWPLRNAEREFAFLHVPATNAGSESRRHAS